MQIVQLGLFLLLQASWSPHVLAAPGHNFSIERRMELRDEIKLLEAKRSPENEGLLRAKRAEEELDEVLQGALEAAPCDLEDLVNTSNTSDPSAMYSEAGSGTVFQAFIDYWRTNMPADSEISAMIARIYGMDNSVEWLCSQYEHDSKGNPCQAFNNGQTGCDATYGWSKNHILTSMTNLNNYMGGLYGNMQSIDSGAADLATALESTFVTFKEVAESIGKIIEEIVGIVLMVVGAATFVFGGAAFDVVGAAMIGAEAAEGVEDAAVFADAAVTDASMVGQETGIIDENGDTYVLESYEENLQAAAAKQESSEAAADGNSIVPNFYKKYQNQFGYVAEQVGVATNAEMILKPAQNAYNTFSGWLETASDYDQLANYTIIGWANEISVHLANLFGGTMPGDTLDANGRSDYWTLHNGIANGAWLYSLSTNNVQGIAMQVWLQFVIPVLELQDTSVRLVMVIRPYACTDETTANKDTLFKTLFADFSTDPTSTWAQSSVTLPEYPNLCFFILDANQANTGTRACIEAGKAGCMPQKQPTRLTPAKGLVNANFNGTAGGTFGVITMADWVKSLYPGWIENNRTNNVTGYTFGDELSADDPKYIFTNALHQANIYNGLIKVCGTDDINVLNNAPTKLTKRDTYPEDLLLIQDNSITAGNDWDKVANRTGGYPCDGRWAGGTS